MIIHPIYFKFLISNIQINKKKKEFNWCSNNQRMMFRHMVSVQKRKMLKEKNVEKEKGVTPLHDRKANSTRGSITSLRVPGWSPQLSAFVDNGDLGDPVKNVYSIPAAFILVLPSMISGTSDNQFQKLFKIK